MIISRSVLLRMRIVLEKVVEKIKAHILCLIFFFRKPCRFLDNVEKYGRARQVTDENMIRRMRVPCRITKATDTHSQCVIIIVFINNNGNANVRLCCVCMYIACLA